MSWLDYDRQPGKWDDVPPSYTAQEAGDIAEAADAKATQAMQPPFTPFSSRGDALATVIPAPLETITVMDPIYGALQYISDLAGTALTTGDGRTWSPLGDAQPAHWGATGDETDSAPLFQLILDWLSPDPNRKLVDKFVGTRYFRTQLNTTGNVVWDAGVAKYIQAHDGRFISGNGNASPDIVAISADYVVGTTNLSVALPVIPKRGDWLRLVSNAVNPNDRSRVGQSNKYRVQEWVQAGEGSTGSNVVLIRPLRFAEGVNDAEDTVIPAFTTAMNCRVALADTSKVFRFTGGYLEQEGPFSGPVPGIFLTAYIGPVVYGTNFYKYYGSALSLSGTIDALVERCTFGEISDNEVISGQQGYGVSDGGENTLVKECRFSKCRHGYTTLRNSIAADTLSIFASGNTVGGLVKDCHSVGSTSRHFDTHHGSVGVTFDGCTAEGGSTGFGGRGYGHAVRNCRAVMTAQGFSTLVEAPNLAGSLDRYATGFTVENCAFQSLGQAFLARNSLVTLHDVTFETPLMRSFETTNSFVTIEGNVSLTISSFRGSVPIPTPASSNPVVLATGLTLFGGAASLIVAKTGRLTLDMSALPSMPGSVLAPASGTTIKVFGTLRVAVPDSVNLMALSAARLIASPTSEFELILPSTSFGFGTAAGKFGRAYDSNGVSLLAGTMTTQAVVGGRFVEWVRDASGTCLGGGWSPAGQATPQHWGAVGDGVADDGPAIAAMFQKPEDIRCFGGVYRIVDRTIAVHHSTRFIGAGMGKTSFHFEDMGGFSGKDGFDILVPIDQELLHSTTEITDCSILLVNSFGRDGIKTPTNPDGQGLTLYGTVRPKFVFNRLAMGSLPRTAVSSSNMFGTWGWKNCIHLGESADSEVQHSRFVQPFRAAAPPEEWEGREETSAVFLDAGTVEEGAGPIYAPILNGITAHGCGKVIRSRGHVVCSRISNMDCFANGWSVYAESPTFSANTGELDGFSETTIENANFNGIFGGIFCESVDFLDVKAVRTTWPSLPSIAYTGEWYGLKIANGFRQVDVRGLRMACYDANSQGTLRGFDLNSKFSVDDFGSGVASLADLYLSRANAASYWQPAALRNIREARVDPIKSRGAGVTPAMLYHETDYAGHTSITPLITVTGPLPYSFSALVEHGSGSTDAQIYAQSRGSTGGWQWVRHADGTFEAWRTINSFAAPNTASGALFVSDEVAFDLPQTLASTPVIVASARAGTGQWVNARPLSTSQGTARVFSVVSVSTPVIVDIKVTGRWF